MYSGNIQVSVQVGRRETSCHMGGSLVWEITMILEESFRKLVNQIECSILSKDLSFRLRVIKDLQQLEEDYVVHLKDDTPFIVYHVKGTLVLTWSRPY
jgi:hypothetical protein